jgi:hypothetical protein
MVGTLGLVVVANLTHQVLVGSVVLVLPALVHFVDVVFFVLMVTGGMIAMVEPVIYSNGNWIYLIDF